ncbi:TetR/AcrR family transcriptional regulator [Harryflintia acetispora]|nr:TetR/AcrR family transcriptional regulator [Harryflintia acetispora]
MKPERKEALAQFHRSQIIAAVRRLYESSGEVAVTMDDIAREAGYSKATLYVYFSGKEEIGRAIALWSMRALLETLRLAAREPGGFHERALALCRALADFYERDPWSFDYAAGEVEFDPGSPAAPQVLLDIYETGEEITRLVGGLLEEGAAQGEVGAPLDVPAAVLLFWGSLCGMIKMAGAKERYIRLSLGLSRREFLERGFTLLLGSLGGGRGNG